MPGYVKYMTEDGRTTSWSSNGRQVNQLALDLASHKFEISWKDCSSGKKRDPKQRIAASPYFHRPLLRLFVGLAVDGRVAEQWRVIWEPSGEDEIVWTLNSGNGGKRWKEYLESDQGEKMWSSKLSGRREKQKTKTGQPGTRHAFIVSSKRGHRE